MGDDRSITTCGSVAEPFLPQCFRLRPAQVDRGEHGFLIFLSFFFVSQIFHMQPDPLDAMASRDAAPAFSAR